MEKNLLTEIHRIQELMGGEKTTLNEQAALMKQLLKKTRGLTDEFISLFRNADIELNSLRQVGSKNTKGEIINAPDSVLDDLYRKVDMDKFVSKLKNTVLTSLNQYEVDIQKQILDELVKGQSITDEMIQGFKELYKMQLDKIASLDGVPNVNAKLVDDFEKMIREFVDKNKPAPKRFTSQEDVIKQISSDLGIPVDKLRSIPGVSAAMAKASRRMEGKTIEAVAKDFDKVLDDIQYNPEFKKLSYKLGTNQFQRIKDLIAKILIAPQRKYYIAGGQVIDPATGKAIPSISKTIARGTLALVVSFLALYQLFATAYYWLGEGKSPGESAYRAFDEAWFSIVSGIFGKIGEYRDEQGDLTTEESQKLFASTLEKLGKNQKDFVFEKIGRGVVRVVDFSDPEENQQDYVIVKDDGEVSIYPWTDDMANVDWSDLTSGTWQKIKSKIKNLVD